ncbi:MAG: membrane integrity-associated transporter subunit PqiC [Sphingomonadales bacterium]|nr:membrane integrity-associated transporter subunit PqiC [Sphingomonadales bacterium]
MTMNTFKNACFAALSLALASCGPLIELPGSGEAPSHYSLQVPTGTGGDVTSTDWKIFLDEPRVPGMLRLDRIAVKSGERETEYLAGARWSDRTPELLQGYWVELLHTQGFTNVFGGDDIEILTDHNVRITVQIFQAEVDGANVVGHVRLHAVLLKNRPVEPVARKTFDGRAQAAGDSKQTIVAVINDALDDASFQMINWLKAEAPSS